MIAGVGGAGPTTGRASKIVLKRSKVGVGLGLGSALTVGDAVGDTAATGAAGGACWHDVASATNTMSRADRAFTEVLTSAVAKR